MMIKIIEILFLIMKSLLWPLFKAFFLSDLMLKYGLYVFIALFVFGGVMTHREERKVRDVATMLAGLIGTIMMLTAR